MTDNTQLNTNVTGGDIIRTDDIGGVKWQVVKLAFGDDGVATLIDAAGALPVDMFPQSPQHEQVTSASLSAGANVDLTTADITVATTGKLSAVDVGGSVPLRCDIQTVSGARVTHTTLFTQAGEVKHYRTPHADFITQGGGIGNGFGVSITNLDTSAAADVYATLFWQEV